MKNDSGSENNMPWLDAWVALAFSVLVFAPILAPITSLLLPAISTNIVLAVVACGMMLAAGYLVWRLSASPKAPAFEHSRGNVG